MALTADKKTEWMEGRDIVYKGSINAKIYAGALVMGALNEMSVPIYFPASDAANQGVLGVALETKESEIGESFLVRTKGVCKFKLTGDAYMVPFGADVYVVDDETVTCDASSTTNSIVAGKFVKLDDDPNYVWVRIG